MDFSFCFGTCIAKTWMPGAIFVSDRIKLKFFSEITMLSE